jgi:hypothetical protein
MGFRQLIKGMAIGKPSAKHSVAGATALGTAISGGLLD